MTFLFVFLSFYINNALFYFAKSLHHYITTGTVLNATDHLNALVRIGEDVYTPEEVCRHKMGTVEFRPVVGMRLPIGDHLLRVVYTPNDRYV